MGTHATFSGGYYALAIPGLGWAQHTYVVADAGGKRVNFPCYGGVDTGHREDDSVFPADLYTQSLLNYENKGKRLTGDLDLARAIVTSNPTAEQRDDYNWHVGGATGLGDNCGIVYGVTGVCHQMAARVLYACDTAVVVWPPTLTATYWRFHGFMGTDWPVFTALVARMRRGMTMPGAGEGPAPGSVAHYVAYAPTPAQRVPHVQEILDSRLGREQADVHAAACVQLDLKYDALKRELDMQLLQGQITNREFADVSNRAFALTAREIADVVGAENYEKIFGLPADQDLTLSIDPGMMPESYALLA